MPSCGKSTVGVLLAKRLGMRFLDSDLVIQEREGRLLHEIIAADGMARFLEIENEICAALEVKDTVISTGGSVVYGKEAMAHLRESGTVIYLKISYETLTRRLGDYVNRGVVLREGFTLADLYRERAALYEQYADYTVDEEICAGGLGETLEKAVEICQNLRT
ncbi:MAG: shikimate kinase [Clostridia bacterium]|nr:shikimate kinase [Clostridia bacterium]